MARIVESYGDWVEASTVSCQFQLQQGDKAFVELSTTKPTEDVQSIYVTEGEINHFSAASGKRLWIKPAHKSTIKCVVAIVEV
jgi:hypothetical protein